MLVVLALGSNVNQEENIRMAEEGLRRLFSAISFTEHQWTTPEGEAVTDDTPMFINNVAVGDSTMSYDELRDECKRLERLCGRTTESKSKCVIPLDIDILQYGDKMYKTEDWNREYINRALNVTKQRI